MASTATSKAVAPFDPAAGTDTNGPMMAPLSSLVAATAAPLPLLQLAPAPAAAAAGATARAASGPSSFSPPVSRTVAGATVDPPAGAVSNGKASTTAATTPATTAATAPLSSSSAQTGSTDPLIAASLSTNGQGSGKNSSDPTPPPTPTTLTRGAAPWSAERVSALISAGTIRAEWLPDIRATALTHLQIQNVQQREMLRFSNAIANTGANNWQVRRGVQLTKDANPVEFAYAQSLGLDTSQLALTAQELLDPNGNIAVSIPDAALSEFHPAHKHFHIGETAEFGVDRYDAASGSWDRITGLEVVKTTFCLIDVNQIQKLADADPDHYQTIKSPANSNVYNDCFADVQGIQDGWMDRYHHSLPGQEVDITNLPAGTYRIISTVNPAGWFLESDFSNNTGWTAFDLSRDSNGNARLREIPGATGGVWFDSSSNGMG